MWTRQRLITKNSNLEDFEITLEGEEAEIVKEVKFKGAHSTNSCDETK